MASHGANNVFLSFSGEDTRHSFTDHLYYALKRTGISTYRDNEEIKRGEKLMPEIKRIIKESRASVVVFSENYATSTWCLDELVLILEQRTECNHFVLPVFYHVDPSDVRKHNKTFAIKVKASSRWTEHNVNLWKKALKEAADLAGMVLSGSEAEFLKEIVDIIYNKLDRKEVNLPPNITGMATRYADFSMWLDQPNVEFLAICGMGGSGKTTLAKYIYDLNWKTYENMSFVEGIGRICEGPNGLHMLQEQLLKGILGGKKRKIPSVFEGTWEIKEALKTKRSLIVLDDITEKSQLVALLGTGVINAQTKIIITTTRENTDNWFKSTNWRCQDYKIGLLNDDESLELFSRHAFGSKVPMEGFEELAVQAVQYCEGNPLALEVLASSLSDNNTILHWKSQLNLLEKEIDSRIQNVLIMSYKSLPFDLEKELFLHIACFFVGIDMDYVVKILEHDYPALSGIKSLSNRCLLSVSPNKKLMMHRLVQEMGKNIVRQESRFPAERSRVWLSGESHKILTKGECSKTMEGLALDMQMLDKQMFTFKSSNLKTDALQKMDRLKLLQLNFVQLTGTYRNFSEDLRWLCWLGSNLRTIPPDLFMGNLVAIDMSYSKLEVFEPPMVLQSLQILNLTHSHDLSEIRNMSMIPHLGTLILYNCRSLARVCKTIGDLKNLALLNMAGCKNLCKSEKTDLDLKASTSGGKVTKQPTFSFPRSLHRLFLNDCNLYCTDSFPLSFSAQHCLEYLNLGYSLFEFLPCYDHLKNLRVLDLTSCSMLKRLPCLPSTLAELYIYYCKSLEEISFQSHRFTLQEFGYRGCISLLEIEGFIKLVPVAKLEGNDLGHMKWIKEYQNHEVCLVGDDELTQGRSSCVQMLYEFNIMSISLPYMENPNMNPTYVSELSSLSFNVPPPPKNRRLKGLDVTFKYTISGDDDWLWFCKISTTNGVDLMYNPKVFGKPESDKVGIWLSYWPIGNTLDSGDKVNVSIAVINGLEVHECGVSLVYADDKVPEETLVNNMEWIEVLGGDLSGFQLSTRAYYLCRRDLFELMEVGRLTPGWFSILVGDTIECTEVRGWRKTGRPMQFNPSFTELMFVRCIIHGPESEEIYKITEMSKSSIVDKTLEFTSSLFGETMKSSTSSKFRETTRKELNEIEESTSRTHGEKLKSLATHGVAGEMEVSLESSMAGKGFAPAIGIDLGTTYSCVGVWQNDQVEIIPNDQGNRTMPSCVSFTNDRRLIGEAAKNQMHINPNNTIYDAKRLIGRRFNDAKLQEGMKLWPFKVIKGTNDIPKIVVPYNGETKEFCAEEISSMVLIKLKEVAEEYLGKTVKDAVITVPAYFDDSQRQATKDAGYIAGLNVLQIINEPTSAAIAYGLDMRNDIARDINVLIFDLGGGTFDVSLVTIDCKGKFQVKAVNGDTHFGGQDFNNVMVDHLVEQFKRRHKTNMSMNKRAVARLREACEKAKRILSSTTEISIEIDCLHEGVDFSMKFTRAMFENLNGDLFRKCIQMVETCLNDAKMNKKDVDEVVLVGGSTRIPKVQQLLKEFFNGKELCSKIHVDEAVAYGAAVLAAKLIGERSQKMNNLVLLDVIPLSLGVEVHDGSLSVIIDRNSPIPTAKQRDYVRSEDDQSIITFDVYQGERFKAIENNWLGKFKVAVPLAPKGKSNVNVVFNIDADGILNCSGEERTTGLKKKITISSDKHRLSKEEIKKMLEDAEKYICEDKEYKKKVFARDALDKYIYDVRRKIRRIRSTAKATTHKEDMEKMENAIEDASQILDESKLADVDEYEKTLSQLEKLCVPIIAKLV